MKKIIALALLCSAIVACKSTKSTTATEKVDKPSAAALGEADAERGRLKFPEVTLERLQQGEAINQKFCSMCHGLKKQADFKAEALAHIVPEMVGKVNRKTGTESISPADQELLLQYLITTGPLSIK